MTSSKSRVEFMEEILMRSKMLNSDKGSKAAEVQNVNQDVRQRSNDTVESSRQKLPSKPQKKQNTGNSNSGTNEKVPTSGCMLIARYSYQGKADSPLGLELTVKCGEKLTFVEAHEENGAWWFVQDQNGLKGYVPASYMKKLDDLTKVSSMPWLQGRTPGEDDNEKKEPVSKYGNLKDPNVEYKKYVPTYGRDEFFKAEKDKELKKYYCDICEKQLNGPQPYSAHMNSKSHKETVEYYNS